MEETVKRLEEKRRTVLLPFWLLLPLLAVSLFLFTVNGIAGMVCLAVSLIAYAAVYGRLKKSYVALYKRLAVKASLAQCFDDLEYEPEVGFDREYMSSLGMMQMGNVYRSEDMIRGAYDGVPFESADLYIADESSDGNGNTSTTVYFKGRWTVFSYNKHFRCELRVRQKGFMYAKLKNGFFSDGAPLEKIRMESEEFNYAYTVYAEDAHEAYYLLTPPVMTAMLRLKSATKGKLMFCFAGEKLHAALADGKDSFEPPVFRRLKAESIINDVLGEANMISGFADELRLEKKIWSQK